RAGCWPGAVRDGRHAPRRRAGQPTGRERQSRPVGEVQVVDSLRNRCAAGGSGRRPSAQACSELCSGDHWAVPRGPASFSSAHAAHALRAALASAQGRDVRAGNRPLAAPRLRRGLCRAQGSTGTGVAARPATFKCNGAGVDLSLKMTTLLRILRLYPLALWVGGEVFFVVVAGIAFSVLPDAHTAGLVVRSALIALHRIAFGAGAVYLLATLGLMAKRDRSPVRLVEIV